MTTTPPREVLDLTIDTRSLQEAVKAAVGAVARDSKQPTLQNVILTAKEGQVRLTGFDGECGVIAAALAVVRAPGQVALPAARFADFVGNITAERTAIRADPPKGRVRVGDGRASAFIGAHDPDDFPRLPEPDLGRAATAEAAALRRAFARVVPCASAGDSRPALTAVNCHFAGDTLVLSGADGFRLARARCPIGGASGGDLLIPARTLARATRLLDGADPIYLAPVEGDRGAWLLQGTVAVFGRLIDGPYPNLDGAIPTAGGTTATVATGALRGALRQARVFGDARSPAILLNAAPGALTLYAGGDGAGDGLSEIDAEVGGAGAIVLDARYLDDVLGANAPARLSFTWAAAHTALAIRDADVEPSDPAAADVWVIMPRHRGELAGRFAQVREEAAALGFPLAPAA